MNKFAVACLLTLATTTLSIMPATAAPNVRDSKYCLSNPYDVPCMDDKMLEMRKAMMSYTKEMAMENRSKYCRESGTGDPVCDDKFMKDTTGY